MRNPKFILTLALLSIAFIGISIFLITAGRTIGQFFFGRSFAEGELREYVERVSKQQVNGVTCQAMDTDRNGYVSCDYTTVDDPNETKSLECAAWGLDGFLNRGCKARLPRS